MKFSGSRYTWQKMGKVKEETCQYHDPLEYEAHHTSLECEKWRNYIAALQEVADDAVRRWPLTEEHPIEATYEVPSWSMGVDII